MTHPSLVNACLALASLLGGFSLLAACDAGGGSGGDGDGGALGMGGASGGTSEAGGRAGAGGAVSSGGQSGTGGRASAGGATGTGGASGLGGVPGSGGGTGGVPGSGGGTGGALGAGGASGGTPGTGGKTGGAPGTGGTSALSDGGADAAIETEVGTDSLDGGPASVRLQGRLDLADATRPSFSWSGSAMFARFQGTGVSLRIDGSPNFFTVVVDGAVLPQVLKTASGTTQYTLASGLTSSIHEVVVWKRTEGSQGENRFLGMDVMDGQLLAPPPAPERRIEIYGDSITAGYGLDGKGPDCGWSPDTENHYLTYGALAARELDADLHAIAWSGIGMYRNYGEDGPSAENMPAVYARTLATKAGSTWNFAAWQPHAVVINLGTNDASTRGDPGTPYRTAYLEFVRTLRQTYPATFFVLSIGPMLDGDNLKAIRTHIQSVISTRAGEGDGRMSYLEFPPQSAADGLGCHSHPGPVTNAAMAAKLVAELKTRLSW